MRDNRIRLDRGMDYLKNRKWRMKTYTEDILVPERGLGLYLPEGKKGEEMNDTEVNKRTREMEKELQEMKQQWVNMYNLLSKLIEDTETEKEDK